MKSPDALSRLLRAWPFALLFLALVTLDQTTKWIARMVWRFNPRDLGFVTFVHATNTGSSFSMLQGWNTALIGVSFVALVALLWFGRSVVTERTQRWWYTLILAGIVGNLIDRVLFGAVTDFIALGWFPVFNVADSCLSIGVVAFVASEFLVKRETSPKKKTRQLSKHR